MNTKIFVILLMYPQLKNLKIKIVKGFTTNPSLMRKAGAKDYKVTTQNKYLSFAKTNQFIFRSIC